MELPNLPSLTSIVVQRIRGAVERPESLEALSLSKLGRLSAFKRSEFSQDSGRQRARNQCAQVMIFCWEVHINVAPKLGTSLKLPRSDVSQVQIGQSNYQLPITKWPCQSRAPVGAAPPTRSQAQLRLQRHTQVPVQAQTMAATSPP